MNSALLTIDDFSSPNTPALVDYLKEKGKYNKGEKMIIFSDVAECLLLVINSFSTMTSYENQTKKAITNSFIQESMTDVLKENLATYFTEKPAEAEKIAANFKKNPDAVYRGILFTVTGRFEFFN